jgi:hypothetical protein
MKMKEEVVPIPVDENMLLNKGEAYFLLACFY